MPTTSDRFNQQFAALIDRDPALRALFPRSVAYTYWQLGQRMFAYNTEPQSTAPRWLSWIYEPIGPGRLSGKATRWAMKRSRRHATRAGAKARALKLYEQALEARKARVTA